MASPMQHWLSELPVLYSVVCCVGSGLCDQLITYSEESYRVCVWVWSRNLISEAAWAH